MTRIDVVAAIIIRDGRILLTQRSPTGSFPWLHECPGGKVEDGEGFDTALKRELDEELGIAARVQSCGTCPIPAIDFDPPVTSRVCRIHFLRADILVGKPRPIVGVGLGWWTADEIARLHMTPANNARINELIALLRCAT